MRNSCIIILLVEIVEDFVLPLREQLLTNNRFLSSSIQKCRRNTFSTSIDPLVSARAHAAGGLHWHRSGRPVFRRREAERGVVAIRRLHGDVQYVAGHARDDAPDAHHPACGGRREQRDLPFRRPLGVREVGGSSSFTKVLWEGVLVSSLPSPPHDIFGDERVHHPACGRRLYHAADERTGQACHFVGLLAFAR